MLLPFKLGKFILTFFVLGDEYPVPTSGRLSSRGDYYAGGYTYGGSRAISPYSVGNTASPRFGPGYPSAYNIIDGSEGFKTIFIKYLNAYFYVSAKTVILLSLLDPQIQTVAAKSAGLLAIVVENLLSHPFLVLKRQCQVCSFLSCLYII